MHPIGVFSDSHGDLKAFDSAFELLKGKGARRFLFLGGRYADLDEWLGWRIEKARGGRAYADVDFLADVFAFLDAQPQTSRPSAFADEQNDPAGFDATAVLGQFVRTPERDSLHYRDASIPKKTVDMLGDLLVCVVHDKNELDREDLLNASVFVHGRAPEPKVVQIGPRFFVTPGMLTGAAEQTCGLFETVEKQLRFSAFTLEGKTRVSKQALVVGGGKTKLSVK